MKTCLRLVKPLIGLVALSALSSAPAMGAAQNSMQCSQKLYSTLFGRAATATELELANPLSNVDSMLQDEEFHNKFGEFVNAHMNWIPAEGSRNNPVYMGITKYLFKPGPNEWIFDENGNRTDQKYTQELPWAYLFTKGYETYDNGYNPKTQDRCMNAASGYFSTDYWQKTYKGNEEGGIKIRTAYMIMNNQIGLDLEALTVNSSGGSGLEARSDPSTVCYACHFATDFALDKVASILPKVDRTKAPDEQGCTDLPFAGNTQTTVYGQTISNLPELTELLAELPQFDENACSIAFEFVFGREERGADREIFEPCIAEFEKSGFITTAVKYFIESEYFCATEG